MGACRHREQDAAVQDAATNGPSGRESPGPGAVDPDPGDQIATDDPFAIEPPADPELRSYRHRRRVQLADGSPRGRMRADAIARELQDVSDEDTTAAGFDPSAPWVVRRAEVVVARFPTFREWIDAETWCSGVGARWAERRVRITGDDGGRVDAAVLWVHLDAAGRPARLPRAFDELFTPAARGRTVRARLQHGPCPDPEGRSGRPFPLRVTDFDLMGHVNNAVSWIPVEEALATRPDLRAPLRLSVEHPASLEGDSEPVVVTADPLDGTDPADGLDLWIVDRGRTCSSAQIRRA